MIQLSDTGVSGRCLNGITLHEQTIQLRVGKSHRVIVNSPVLLNILFNGILSEVGRQYGFPLLSG